MHIEEIDEALTTHAIAISTLTQLVEEQDKAVKALNTNMRNYIEQTRPLLEGILKMIGDD